MANCSACGHQNRVGVIYCEACSKPLTAFDGLSTRQIGNSFKVPTLRRPTGTGHFRDNLQLVIHIQDVETPLIIDPRQRMILGRGGSKTNRNPEIDLADFDALKKGVSRVHAMINLQDDALTITDMGSINGTYLNGERLPANSNRILHDGDEIRLGKLMVRTYFQCPS
jgi:hypothetical protein